MIYDDDDDDEDGDAASRSASSPSSIVYNIILLLLSGTGIGFRAPGGPGADRRINNIITCAHAYTHYDENVISHIRYYIRIRRVEIGIIMARINIICTCTYNKIIKIISEGKKSSSALLRWRAVATTCVTAIVPK